MPPSLHHKTSNTSHMCPFPLLSACSCRHLYLYSTCFPVKVIWNQPDAKFGSTKEMDCASFLLPWEVEVNIHQRAVQRTNLEVMSRKTTRPPQLHSITKKFAKRDAPVCGGPPYSLPKGGGGGLGLFWRTATEHNHRGVLGKRQGSDSQSPPPSVRSAWRNLEDVPTWCHYWAGV